VQDIYQLVQTVALGSCYQPFRTIVVGAGLSSLLVYAARRSGGTLRDKRIAYALFGSIVLLGAAHFHAFEQACARETLCGVTWELNCSAVNRAVFQAGRVVFGIVALASVGAFVRRPRL
jgi:hypothetical protein